MRWTGRAGDRPRPPRLPDEPRDRHPPGEDREGIVPPCENGQPPANASPATAKKGKEHREPMAATHWTEDLFLRHPEVFLTVHENAWSTGEEQARDLRAILERFGVPPGGRILDAPCGIGRHSTRLAKVGYRTVGVDLSPVFVDRATGLARQEV